MAGVERSFIGTDSYGNGVFVDVSGIRPLGDGDHVEVRKATDSPDSRTGWSDLPWSQRIIVAAAFGSVLGGCIYRTIHDANPTPQKIGDEQISTDHS